MAQAALLDREYQTSAEDEYNTPEAIAHRQKSHEVFDDVFRSKEYDAEKIAAQFSVSTASAPAAVAAPAAAPAAAPVATPAVATPARREAYSNFEYKDHAVRTEQVKEATTVAPEVAPAPEVTPAPAPEVTPAPAAPKAAPAPETEESEDLRPTRRTMETLQREELYQQGFEIADRPQERVGFFASLSSKAKMALAIVSALVVVAIAIVCINTGIINSIKSDVSRKRAELQQLSEYSEELNGRIEAVTDPAYVDDYAEHELGMTRS